MKRENIDRSREKRGAVIGVALFGALQLACVICFGALCLIPGLPTWLLILVWWAGGAVRRDDASGPVCYKIPFFGN